MGDGADGVVAGGADAVTESATTSPPVPPTPSSPSTPVQASTSKKRGRGPSQVWEFLTGNTQVPDRPDPQCMHCNVRPKVGDSRKSEVAKTHLVKCDPFIRVMNRLDPEARPEWFNTRCKGAKSKKTRNTLGFSTDGSISSTPSDSIAGKFIPKMTASEQAKFDLNFGMHYFITGTAFQRSEEPNLRKAIQTLRPDAKVPGRKKLANTLLKKCYNKVKGMTDLLMKVMVVYACLTSDGWSNVSGDPVVNYMMNVDDHSLFLETVYTGKQSHNAEWIALDLGRVIDKMRKENVNICGAVTDNTSTNKAAWILLSRQYPDMFFQGCTSHALHLLVKDIFGPSKILQGRATKDYPINYPFKKLLDFVQLCKDIVTFFTQHHMVKAVLEELQKKQTPKSPALISAAPTRWGSILAMMTAIKENFSLLIALVHSEEWMGGILTRKQKTARSKLFKTITDEEFMPTLIKCLKILAPIDAAIVLFQNDKVPVSMVFKTFEFDLKASFDAMAKRTNGVEAVITKQEHKYMIDLLDERKEFVYGDASGFGYLLDPRFTGAGLTRTATNMIAARLLTFAVKRMTGSDALLDEREKTDMVGKEYFDFIAQMSDLRSSNDLELRLVMSGKTSVMTFWKNQKTYYPLLYEVACRVFAMSPSSASSERNFSTLAFIHSKLRNKLGPAKVGMLAYIKTNFAQAGGYEGDMKWVNEMEGDGPADYSEEADDVSVTEDVAEGDGVFGEDCEVDVSSTEANDEDDDDECD